MSAVGVEAIMALRNYLYKESKMRIKCVTILAAAALAAGCFAVCAKELTTSQKVERQIVAASDKVQKKEGALGTKTPCRLRM